MTKFQHYLVASLLLPCLMGLLTCLMVPVHPERCWLWLVVYGVAIGLTILSLFFWRGNNTNAKTT